jgi:nitric oxide synthase-interacting protein
MIKSHQASLAAHAEAEQAQIQQAKAEARARVLRDFERGLTFNIGGDNRPASLGPNGSAKNETTGKDKESAERGTKRKFELDESAVERLALEAEEAAMKVIEAEQVCQASQLRDLQRSQLKQCVHQAEARRAKLPAFWLPTLAPEAQVGPLKDVKLQTLCQVGEHPHPTS